MKCFLFACLILATATVAEAGHNGNGNLRIVCINGQNFAVDSCGNAQRLGRGNNFNRFRSNRGRLNSSGGFGGQRNVNFGLINFN
jgi:hypothetical protein